MKTYEAVYMPQDNICWEQVTKEDLACAPWAPVDHIRAWFQLCWNEEGLHVRMQAKEKDILRRFTGQLDAVCKDSCLEFFFSAEPDGRYINVEINPNGAMYLGLRYNRYRYIRLVRNDLQEVLRVQPFFTGDGWGVEYCLPVNFLQLFYPELSLTAGKSLRANFYKCGEDTTIDHHLVWNNIETAKPDFHQPAFFGRVILK